MIIKQISVFCENKPGKLVEITSVIANAGVSIRAFSIADTTDFGILRLIVTDPDKALEALRANNMTVSMTNVIAAHMDDKSGALNGILQIMNNAGISLEYAYAFITRKQDDAYVILRVEDIEKSIETLQKAGVELLSANEVYEI